MRFLIIGAWLVIVIGCASRTDLTSIQEQIDEMRVDHMKLQEMMSQSFAVARASYVESAKANTNVKKVAEVIDQMSTKINKLVGPQDLAERSMSSKRE